MKTIGWAPEKLPVCGEWDVVVAGAGMGGITAAICAARGGLRTALIEYFGIPGGIPTAGLLCCISGQDNEREQVVAGFVKELETRAIEAGVREPDSRSRYEPEGLKRLLLRMLKEAGVEMFFYTQLIGVVRGKDRVTHAVVASKSGVEALQGKLFVDGTGDADLAAMAGAPFEKGRTSDGLMQSCSLVFVADGIDRRRTPEWKDIDALWKEKDPPFPINHVVLTWVPNREGAASFNMVHILRFDGTSNTELTRARLQGTEQAYGILQWFKDNVPGFEKARMLKTGDQIGVRETRRIAGDYTLTEEDCIACRSFEDEVARCIWPIDVHTPDGIHTGIDRILDASYGVPYRCMVPKGLRNVYVVGRPISATHVANSSCRINATCMAIGEAAGRAAGQAIAAGDVRQVNVQELQGDLEEHGAILHRS